MQIPDMDAAEPNVYTTEDPFLTQCYTCCAVRNPGQLAQLALSSGSPSGGSISIFSSMVNKRKSPQKRRGEDEEEEDEGMQDSGEEEEEDELEDEVNLDYLSA